MERQNSLSTNVARLPGAHSSPQQTSSNFVFQRLLESGADVEKAYEQDWKDFETAFWEISVGRVRTPRSSIFLNHWLISRTGEEIVTREVFTRFKSYADFDVDELMSDLLQRTERASIVYRAFVQASEQTTGPLDRLGLFGYRTGVLESEVIKPLVLYLLDPDEATIPEPQITKALNVV